MPPDVLTYLSASGLSKRYRGAAGLALDDCSLSVGPGELIAVIGHNGAGKSTLFDTLGGFSRPDSGAVSLTLKSSEIGWCPQREIIDWSLTVGQNIALGLDLRRRVGNQERRRYVNELAEALGLTQFIGKTAETLSGGELRRTQIARAMVGEPRLMILDEPTTGLDPAGIRVVFDYLEARRKTGASALVSTHETSRFARACTRVIALRGGRIIADNAAAVFMERASGSEDLWDAYEALREAIA